MPLVRTLLLLAAFLLAGCTKAIVGDWQGEAVPSCGESDLEIEEGSFELEGKGTLRVIFVGNCQVCPFELSGDHDEGDKYNFSVQYEGCACDTYTTTGDAECEVGASKHELECNFTLGSCLDVTQDFERD